MDPGRLALPSSGTNADMLLYTPQARVHTFTITEKAPFERTFPWYPILVRNVRTISAFNAIVANHKIMSRVCTGSHDMTHLGP